MCESTVRKRERDRERERKREREKEREREREREKEKEKERKTEKDKEKDKEKERKRVRGGGLNGENLHTNSSSSSDKTVTGRRATLVEKAIRDIEDHFNVGAQGKRELADCTRAATRGIARLSTALNIAGNGTERVNRRKERVLMQRATRRTK